MKTKTKSRKWLSKISDEQKKKRDVIFEYWVSRIEERTKYNRVEIFARGRKREFVLIRMFLVDKLKGTGLWNCVGLGDAVGRSWREVGYYIAMWNDLKNDREVLSLIKKIEYGKEN